VELLFALFLTAAIGYALYWLGRSESERAHSEKEVVDNAKAYDMAQKAAAAGRDDAKSVSMSTDPNNRDNWVQ
jgi:hypothetical protein